MDCQPPYRKDRVRLGLIDLDIVHGKKDQDSGICESLDALKWVSGIGF
jgi:hypothetical protein